MVELVEGLGVYVPAHRLLGCIRASPSGLARQLMSIVFTEEQLSTCSVRGKGDRQLLPSQQMEAILGMLASIITMHACIYVYLGYVLTKYPNERTEYLVRQANDKCNRVRAKLKH